MAERQSNFTATEIKAGALVLASVVLLVVFIATIRGCAPRGESSNRYYATFTGISGLNRGADVRFGGVKVGRVIAIEPSDEERSKIRVTAEVLASVPVNEASVASIQQVTLTTEKHLEISTGGNDDPLLSSGDTIPASEGGGGLIDMPDLESVTARLERLLDGVIALLGVDEALAREESGEQEMVDLAELLANLDDMLDSTSGAFDDIRGVVAENRPGFRDVVAKLIALEDTTTALMQQANDVVAENREPLGATAQNLEKLTEEANRQVAELAASLRATLAHFEDVGGNASDLVDEQRLTIEEILLNLQATTRNLSELSRTLAEQPQALIRGKGARGRKDEE